MSDERSRKTVAIGAMAEMYRRELTPSALWLYVAALGDVSAAALEAAIVAAIRSSRWMPAPAELRELAGCASATDRAVQAFAALSDAIPRHGAYASVDFDDRLINATVRMLGGWERACGLTAEEFDKWFRKDFLGTYETLARTGINGDADAPLTGIHERTNRGLGQRQTAGIATVRTGLPWASEQPRRLCGEQTCSGLLTFQKA